MIETQIYLTQVATDKNNSIITCQRRLCIHKIVSETLVVT